MTLQGVVQNSNYMTDEDMISSNLLGIGNNAISEVNAKVGTKLPFFEDANIAAKDYWAIPDFWVLRLIEPYYSFVIMANDGDVDARDFHYQRFLAALEDFKDNGLDDIADKYPDDDPDHPGEDTGFAGDVVKHIELDVSERTVKYFGGW